MINSLKKYQLHLGKVPTLHHFILSTKKAIFPVNKNTWAIVTNKDYLLQNRSMTKISHRIKILTQTNPATLIISYSDKAGDVKEITYWPKTGKSTATERDAINILDEVKEYLMTHDLAEQEN